MQPDPRASPGWQRPPEPPVTGWWFLVPLLTCGLCTAPMVLFAALRLRSKLHALLAGGYFAALMLNCAISAAVDTEAETLLGALAIMASLALWIVGSVHVSFLATQVRAAFFRQHPSSSPGGAPGPRVYGRAAPRPGLGHYPPPRPAWQQAPGVDPALAKAQWRAARREEARKLQSTQPSLAAELMIGRPDLPGRQYDDGGLVDVNHVPAEVLMRHLSIDRPLAEQIVAARDLHHGLSSADELIVYCEGLTPAKLDTFRDRLVFNPR